VHNRIVDGYLLNLWPLQFECIPTCLLDSFQGMPSKSVSSPCRSISTCPRSALLHKSAGAAVERGRGGKLPHECPSQTNDRTTNWKDYNTALKPRGSLLIWLDKDMCWHGSANGKRGRRQKYSEAAIQFWLTIKDLYDLALRQAIGMAQNLRKLAGLDWEVPDFSTVSRRQKHL
jgi:hypothetical protein